MLCSKETAKDTGLNIWVDPEDNANQAEVDIIAVQGLGSDKYYTWVKKKSSATHQEKSKSPSRSNFFTRHKVGQTLESENASQSNNSAETAKNATVEEVMWLRDLLPRFLPNARIATYSYKSDWRQDVKTNLRKCGEQLLNVLYQNRLSEKEAQRPLILIGHSLGGLVIKQALVLANHNEIYKDLKLSVVGIIFLGTPHQGSDAAEYGKWLARATERDTTLLESLTRNSQVLYEIGRDFGAGYSNGNIVCFYEENNGLLGIKFVDFRSASLDGKRSIYLTTDHSGLNKFHGFEDENFQLILPEIQRMVQSAQMPTTESNFDSSLSRVPSMNPFRVNFSLKGIPVLGSFVARDVEMARIAEFMLPRRSASADQQTRRKICILHGLGGIGKTQLAIEFARKYRKNYSAVFWIDGSSKEKLKQNIANLAKNLPQHQLLERAKSYSYVQQPHIKELNGAVEDVLSWFSQSSNEHWLVVYDNIDREFSAGNSDPEAFNLKEYLPEADHGCILITSRLTSLLHLGGANIKVGPVSEFQGESILSNSIGEPVRDSRELVSLLQGLPLAINHAGAYIRTTGTSVLAYIKLYTEAWKNLMESQHRFSSHGSQDRSVLTTWTLLFRQLEKQNGHAAKLLILWGFLDHSDIWYDLFRPALDLTVASELPRWYTDCVNDYSNFVECIKLFVLYSFVDVKVGSSSFSMHPVLHQWCFQASEENMAEMSWLAVVIVASAAPSDSTTTADYTLIQRRLLPHCDCISPFLLLEENIPKAPYKEEREEKEEEEEEEEESSLNIAYRIVGDLYHHQSKFREAEKIYVRALAASGGSGGGSGEEGKEKEKVLGPLEYPKSTSRLEIVSNLGIIYQDQGRLGEAEDMFMRALAGYEKAFGPEATSTLNAVVALGIIYDQQGKLSNAEDMYMRALAGYEKAVGPENPSTLDTINNLGLLYVLQGKLSKAEDMYRRALAGYEKAFLGPDHPSTLNTATNLGILYHNQGKLAEAENMLVKALAGVEKAWGPEHTLTLRTVFSVADLYRQQGKFSQAEDMYMRALEGYEKALGPEHTLTLDTVNHLACLYVAQEKTREAEDMYMRALVGFDKTLGPEHDKTIMLRRDITNNLNKRNNSIIPRTTRRRDIISRLFHKREDKT